MAERWHVVEARGVAGLEDMERDWRRLYARIPLRTSFLSYEACLARVKCLPWADKVRCLALADEREVRALCVLEPGRKRLLRRDQRVWRVLWLEHSRQASALCPDDGSARALVPALVAYLRRRHEGRRLLLLGPAPASSAMWAGLRDLPRLRYRVEPRETVWILDCARPFGEVRASLPRHFRHNLNTARNRLAKLGDVQYVFASDPADIEAELRTFLEVEASGWKGERGTRSALRNLGAQRAVFEVMARDLHEATDYCEISSLRAGERCLASLFATRTGGVYSGLKIGRDEEFDRVSPGHLLVEKTVERCCEDPGIRCLDMVSNADWVRGWQPDGVPLQAAYVILTGAAECPFTAAALWLRLGPGRRSAQWLRGRCAARQRGDRRRDSGRGTPHG